MEKQFSPSLELKARVIVCSDRASEGSYEDKSGPEAVSWLTQNGFLAERATIIPDEKNALTESILSEKHADLVVISGGTGLGPRDITPQTLDEVCDYAVPGFGELLRQESLKYSLNAYLSRCGAWVKDQRLFLALPGNPKAVCEQLDILKDILPHALSSLRGKCAHRRKTEHA